MDPADSPRPPRVFVSYSHDSPAHMDRVLALCDRLRHDGIDADLDQYEAAPPEGWPRWTMRQVETADFVLVVCTEVYRRRFDGKEEKGKGLGVAWEGAVLTQILYDAAAVSGKFVPVVFGPEDTGHIPTVLKGPTYYDLSSDTGYEQLYRYFTDQPAVPRPELGKALALPSKPRSTDFPTPSGTTSRRKRWPWRVGGAAFAILLSLIGYQVFGPASPTKPSSPPPMLLWGEIQDAETHLPMSGVLVRLPEHDLKKTTDRDGQYRFMVTVPAWTQVKLVATREGYKMVNRDFPAGSGKLDVIPMWKNP